MKIKLFSTFRYQVNPTTVVELAPGIHDLPQELVQKILRFGNAELVTSKKAPENKIVTVPENKAAMAGTKKRRSRSRSKSKRKSSG